MESERIARLTRDAFLKEPLFQGFTDIRKRPQIRLQAILMSLFAMPLFGRRSLLSIDRHARTSHYKKLFGCQRKMVASDSTFARVLKWLYPQQVKQFLLGFLQRFEAAGSASQTAEPEGEAAATGDPGRFLHGRPLACDAVPGGQNRLPGHGGTLPQPGRGTADGTQVDAGGREVLGKLRPELWLLDALYFNTNTIAIARGQHSHVLFKFKDADYRTVTADASNLFQYFGGDEELSGWDSQRGCRWKVRKTLDRFASYPVQVVQLTETYPKRKRNRTVISWIVTTDLELPLEEVREAAHQRWQIENGIFKRISHLAGTKTFYFKDHRQFFNLLRLFFAAMAVLDCIMWMLRAHSRLFAALRFGIKDTWLNVFSRIDEVLGWLPCAFAALV